MNNAIIYLGTAIEYPISLQDGSPQLVAGLTVVGQSIKDILNTPIGTRLFLRQYGSRLRQVQFEVLDESVEALLDLVIFEALEKWETRAVIESITYASNTDEGSCTATINTFVPKYNQIAAFVYPFYTKLKY
jgi:phage baseplate assembly protein W